MRPSADPVSGRPERPAGGARAGGGRGTAIAALTAVTVVLFAPVLVGGESFFGRDIAPFFWPMKEYLRDAVRAGRLPLWNPWVASGVPFFASLQPGLLYPPSLLLYALPLPPALDLLIVAHFPVAAFGMWALLRRWGSGVPGALVGAAAFAFGGYFVSIANFPNNLQTVTWIPWLFLVWDRWLETRGRREALWFAGLCVVAFLGGEPQMLALALGCLLLHGLLRVERPGPAALRQLGTFAGVGLLALLLAGVQLVPFLEYLGESVRVGPLSTDYAARVSLEPTALVHLLLPPALGEGAYDFTTRHLLASRIPWLLSVYPGAVAGALAAAGLAAAPRRRAAFWAAAGVVGLVLALGRFTPVFPFLHAHLPPLQPFRYPEKFMLLPVLGGCVLAATGTDRALERRGGVAVVLLLAAAGLYAALAAAAGPRAVAALCEGPFGGVLACGTPAETAALYRSTALRLATLCALAGLAFAALARRGSPRLAAAVLFLVLVADLSVAHRSVNPTVDRDVYRRTPWAVRQLPESPAERQEWRFRGSPYFASMGSIVMVTGALELSNMFLDRQALGPNLGAVYGVLQQDGLQGVELRSVALTNDAAVHEWADDPVRYLRTLNVRWYADATAFADSLEGLRALAAHPELPLELFEVPDPVPRARLVGRWERAAGPAEALRRALEREGPPGAAVVLERAPPMEPAGRRGEVMARSWGAERVALRVRTDGPMLLVIADRWFPGWRAEVDGQEAPVLRADGVFRAVPVPAGESEVVLRYRPASLPLGAALSGAGLLVLAGLLGTGRREGGA